MLKRERDILAIIRYSDYDITIPAELFEDFTDEEVISDLFIFKGLKGFTESEKYKNLVFNISNNGLKDYLAENDYVLLPMPENLKTIEVFQLIEDPIFKQYMDKCDFTRKYFYTINKDSIVRKYKDCIDFNVLLYTNSYIDTKVLEILYDDISKIDTSTILNIITKYQTQLNGLLIDRLESMSKESKSIDLNIVNKLLEGMKYADINDENLKYIFDNFDDNYIINHIEIFDYRKILQAGRLTEDIFQAIIDYANSSFNTLYRPFLSEAFLSHNYSKEFIVKNNHVFRDVKESYMQKEIISLYPERDFDWIDPSGLFALNPYLTDNDIHCLMDKIDISSVIRFGTEDEKICELTQERINLYTLYLKEKNNGTE